MHSGNTEPQDIRFLLLTCLTVFVTALLPSDLAALSCAESLLAPYSASTENITIPVDVPVIDITELSNIAPIERIVGDGGSSLGYKATFKGQTVHIKNILYRSFHPDDVWELNNEFHFFSEFSKREKGPQLVGVTKMDGRLSIVSEYQNFVGVLKTISGANYERNFDGPQMNSIKEETLKAVSKCPNCKVLWAQNIRILADWLEKSRVYILDPQFMLLEDGKVLIYDFSKVKIEPADSDRPQVTRRSIENMIRFWLLDQ